ncbi:TolC family protein [Pelomonas sp. V22]|uniref:TolC family protein n=1 Tax=Pelomonas sp. V22 TaxID=2822139 RepID=UPI0024A84D53|nr:TolC family protein [Pelomonas sp. V22]MDI4635240.1 TolC family protein [Pelomonas sp. V22]
MHTLSSGRGHPRPGLTGLARGLLCLLAGASLAGPASALSYTEALAIAERQHPALRAQQANVDSASALQGAAGSLPDPRLSVGVENLPTSGMDRWSLSRDFMTMQRIALMQEVPNSAKRAAQAETAQARIERERAMLVVQRLQVRQALGTAWVGVQAVEQRRAVLQDLVTENQRLQQTLPARIAGGTAGAADLLMARQEALGLADRLDELQRDADKARAALRRLIGPQAEEALEGDAPLPLLSADELRARLHSHAELAPYPAMQAMARGELREAQAESRGDWSWEVAYSRRGRQWGDMVSFQLSFDLPWQKDRRQQPGIAAKQREAERVALEREEVERRHRQELEDELAEQQSLARQIARLESDGLLLARERLALAMSSYESGKSDLGSVLAARAQLLELRLRRIDLQSQQSLLRVRLNSLSEE